MYKRFVNEFAELEPFRAQCEAAGALGDPPVDELWTRIEARMKRAAEAIRSQAATSTETADARAKRRPYQWGTVRIFISSTFKDFFAERESLIKRVFPNLREWCQQRRIALYDYDLRWGVPKDATGSEAVRTCLDLCDRCLGETEGRAFFLGLVGDRFGWVPTVEDLEEELHRRYDWTFGSSVTQVEVVHGAMTQMSPNAIFMIRDSACYAALPDGLRKDFVEPSGSVTERHVARQKLEVVKRFPPDQVRLYNVQYAGTVKEGRRERVQFTGLEDFEQRVLDFFQKVIAAEFPLHVAAKPRVVSEGGADESPENTVDDNESNETHIGYMFSLANNAQGQNACQKLMLEFAEADNPDVVKLPPLFGDLEDGAAAPGLKALVLSGDSGAGKSTALSRLGQNLLENKKYDVLVHFAQFSSISADWRVLKNKLREFFIGLLPNKVTAEYTKDTKIQEILDAVAQIPNRRILILIDAYESFFESAQPLDLLPPAWPDNVRCIVTCHTKEISRCFNNIAVHLYELEPLDSDACRAVCRAYLDEFGKRLDAAQLSALLCKTNATNPLWLTQACEELRVFGDYSAVSQVIADFPDKTRELLKFIGARILKDNPDGIVAALLSLVGISRIGLWEHHARRLLRFVAQRSGSKENANEEGEPEADEVPLADYLRARRETKSFLRSIARESTCLTFQHWASRSAVESLLLAEPEVASRWHSLMVDFILSICQSSMDAVLIRDLPHHLYMSDRRTELHKILTNDSSTRHMPIRIHNFTSSGVYNTWRCRSPKVNPVTKQSTISVCTMCKNTVSRGGVLKSNACIFCGMMTLKGSAVPAVTCMMHQAMLPSMLRCWYCGRNDPNAVPLSMCHMCNMGNPAWCCHPLLETDRMFQGVARSQLKRSNLVW